MISSYAQLTGQIPPLAFVALEMALDLWQSLPDPPQKPVGAAPTEEPAYWNCHGLCAAVDMRLKANVADLPPGAGSWEWVIGQFAGPWQHSWIVLRVAQFPEIILDVAPVMAAGGPLLLVAQGMTPWARAKLYDGQTRSSGLELRREGLAQLEQMAQLLAARAAAVPD